MFNYLNIRMHLTFYLSMSYVDPDLDLLTWQVLGSPSFGWLPGVQISIHSLFNQISPQSIHYFIRGRCKINTFYGHVRKPPDPHPLRYYGHIEKVEFLYFILRFRVFCIL